MKNKVNNRVAIIIPIFNAHMFLKKCLDSIVHQSYKSFDIICVNDGSTDKSSSILESYSQMNHNIIVLSKHNGGPSSARNYALDFIKDKDYDFITFIDADDWVEKDYLKTLIDMSISNDADVVAASFSLDYGNHIRRYNQIECDSTLSNVDATKLLLKDETIQSHSHTKLYKKSLWDNVRFNASLFYMEDQAVIFQLFYKSNQVYVTNYAGYHYYQSNNNSITKTGLSQKKIISGLRGYFLPCVYAYKEEDMAIILKAAYNALAAAFLMLIPYYKKKDNTKEGIEFINGITKYIKDNKIIKNYVPNSKANKVKKFLYLMCPPLYKYTFKIAKKFS